MPRIAELFLFSLKRPFTIERHGGVAERRGTAEVAGERERRLPLKLGRRVPRP